MFRLFRMCILSMSKGKGKIYNAIFKVFKDFTTFHFHRPLSLFVDIHYFVCNNTVLLE